MPIVKRFLIWIRLKEKLHNNKRRPPLISEGDIWWVSLGENVGQEINGKSFLFSRPMLVFKKLSRETFLGIPTTSQSRAGSWYVPITYGEYTVTVILSQVRVLDARRLSTKLGQLDEADFEKVKTGFAGLFLPNYQFPPREVGRGKSPK